MFNLGIVMHFGCNKIVINNNMIFFCLIGHSCWMFIGGGEAWFFGGPVLILVLVGP